MSRAHVAHLLANLPASIGKAAVLLVASLLLTAFVPGIVAARGGVLTNVSRARMPEEARRRLDLHNAHQRSADETEARLLERIDRDTAPEDVRAIYRAIREIHQWRDEDTAPIVVLPYLWNPQLWLWPSIYATLLIVSFIIVPARYKLNARSILKTGLAIYVIYQWPLWLRNAFPDARQRIVFAYPNIDIDKGSFICQELLVLGFALALATTWERAGQWLGEVPGRDLFAKGWWKREAFEEVSDAFWLWMIASLLLALGFGWFTWFFWALVSKAHDVRYLPSAVLCHLLWGVTWVRISAPMVVIWRGWVWARHEEVHRIAISGKNGSALSEIGPTLGLSPLANSTLLVSKIVAIVAFVIPIIQAL